MNNEIIVPSELSDLDRAIFLVKLSDKAVSATRKLLYEIYSSNSWEAKYDSWGEFVEEGLNKSRGWATKQIKVYEHYCLNGGIVDTDLEMDTEKLYLARNLSGSLDEQIAKAKTLNRSELRKEQQEDTPHAFEPLTICKKCHASQENHS